MSLSRRTPLRRTPLRRKAPLRSTPRGESAPRRVIMLDPIGEDTERIRRYGDAISEASFTRLVMRLAEYHGWHAHHDWDSRGSLPGFPDLVLIREQGGLTRVIFAELKKKGGRLSPEQRELLEWLRRCPGVETYLWFPGDWDRIREVLQ